MSKKHKQPKTRAERAEINRRNAQKSTGPKTAQGKAKSSQNAFKYGLTGGFCLLRHENAEAFWEHVNKLMIEQRPQGYEEHLLVTLIGECYWRINRAIGLESMATDDSDCREDMEQENARTQLYINRITRQMKDHYARLKELKALRQAGQHHSIPNADLFPETPADEDGCPSFPSVLPLTRAEGERYRWRRDDMAQGIHRPTEGGLYKWAPRADSPEAGGPMASFFQPDDATGNEAPGKANPNDNQQDPPDVRPA